MDHVLSVLSCHCQLAPRIIIVNRVTRRHRNVAKRTWSLMLDRIPPSDLGQLLYSSLIRD
jgi:hypothetical protein